MSIQSRAMQYGRLFGDWKIRDFIGEGSGGKTGVFRIIKTYGDFTDESALKVVTILREDGRPEELAPEALRDYKEARRNLCAKAVNEVKLMKCMADDPYVVSYQNWQFCDWEEPGQFGCDLLIQMRLLVTLERLQKREGAYREEEVLRVGRDICRALVRCRQEGILHRDIKPANIFIDPGRKGCYMLGDFGVSRIVENGLGGASTEIGTPQYAAPEQFRPGYDSRVDLYSLGLTLYQLANRGRLPFQKSGCTVREALLPRLAGEPLPPPDSASPDLAAVILRACAFRPEDRFQSAEAFLEALEAVGRSEVEEAETVDGTLPDWDCARPQLQWTREELDADESLNVTVSPEWELYNQQISAMLVNISADGSFMSLGKEGDESCYSMLFTAESDVTGQRYMVYRECNPPVFFSSRNYASLYKVVGGDVLLLPVRDKQDMIYLQKAMRKLGKKAKERSEEKPKGIKGTIAKLFS